MHQLLQEIQQGNFQALARAITLVENNTADGNKLLQQLHLQKSIPVIGITGPPGAGKSSLVNSLLDLLIAQNKTVGVIAVDPSSPFNLGALLGDRVRMSKHFNSGKVFIRSMASRGSLGGLCDKILEVTDVMRQAPFDFVLVETVGVGQSEVEIAGLADTTVVVLVPEAGDEVQTMKAGLMEIADVFVVNKADHADADKLFLNLKTLVHEKMADEKIGVVKTIATQNEGTADLLQQILLHHQSSQNQQRKLHLLTEKAWRIIQTKRMENVSRESLQNEIAAAINTEGFNIYKLAATHA